jgi:hypothetical protein
MSPDSLPHYFGDQIKEDEMVGTCRMHMIAKYILFFGNFVIVLYYHMLQRILTVPINMSS